MLLTVIFCSFLDVTKWLQNHLITCPFKKLTGIDCPGCGFQRSVIALLQGDLKNSLHLYPATIPLLITTLFVFLSLKLNMDNRHIIKKTFYMITGLIIIGSYLFKIYTLYV
jgi:hypothetical protein